MHCINSHSSKIFALKSYLKYSPHYFQYQWLKTLLLLIKFRKVADVKGHTELLLWVAVNWALI